VWLVVTLADGATYTLSIQARVDCPAAQTNTATISDADHFDPDPVDNSASSTDTQLLSGLSITKTNTPGINGNVDQANDTVTPGSTTTYTLVVSNPSMNYVDLATLIDPATTGLTKTAVACTATTAGAVCPAAGDVTVAALESAGGIVIPTLPPNSTMTFTVTATNAVGTGPASDA
jgi:hypothetical protein